MSDKDTEQHNPKPSPTTPSDEPITQVSNAGINCD